MNNTSFNRTFVNKVILLLTITFTTLLTTGCGYNRLQAQDVAIEASWSEVINQYQRRAQLIPQLVQVTKKYAEQEQEIFTEVADARAKVGSIQLTEAALTNPEAMEQFQAAQNQMTGALSKLLAVSENYPDLASDQVFLSLQDEIAGTENRIAVARRNYIKQVQAYNTTVRKFPSNITASVFGMKTKANFSTDNVEAISEAPTINFDNNNN